MDITPTPEFMEAFGRAQAKHGEADPYRVREEMFLMRKHGDSVRAGLTSIEEQHAAVAAAFPHLYTTANKPPCLLADCPACGSQIGIPLRNGTFQCGACGAPLVRDVRIDSN